MQVDAFKPTIAGTVVLTVTEVEQGITLKSGSYLELQNSSTSVVVFFEQALNGATPTANVTTSYPVMPGQSKIIRRHASCTKLSIIGASAGPTTVYVTTGEGV